MKGQPWSEDEIRAAIGSYFKLLDDQECNKNTNKVELYKKLSATLPDRSAKSFEFKFQNISAVLYEEKLPYADGLLPRYNYQRL